ncbi:BMP family lipoprotein [Entomospira culicis]|uniref:BMP family ABC transporter substrate-binding protein n=1 Tax=Entomospira culicis TaxID=2719989 RepID=A0A968GF88_9SPIO|nr:BMP family ABC transporter substrate-binding protein [Entomospira culicis]NIZ18977.1 BMP family ABC transporter substrate-binding protein [Entomospira culicis]NIZ69192.1 BMP family ABC transporter substrate-binding protein [Entomospira culicis]WDI37778.1 BMP family ABC transporter substrate-binding protein [Entomospira culicis]WDI39406.1 BMP family ABC transporter substrate-binding protein [Entomospira culicis]
MKGYVRLLAVSLASLALFSCGGSGNNQSSGGGRGMAMKDVILVDEGSGIDDKSFNAATWRGITAHFGDTPENASQRGVRYEELYSSSQDKIWENLNIATDEGARLIIGTGFTFEEPIQRVAKANPDQHYLLIDGSNGDIDNLRGVLFKEHEGAFLVGVAVALQAQADGIADPKFGFVGGMQSDVISRFELGYIQGILSVLPDALIEDFYADSWGAPEVGKTKAKDWFNKGFYAILSAAGGTGSGVIAEAKEQRMLGKNVWALGVDSDQYEDGLYSEGESAVLTSMLKLVEKAVSDALIDVDSNQFTGGTVYYGLAEGGVGFSTRNSRLNEEVIAQVRALADKIVRGEIVVYGTYAEAKANNLLPNNPLILS